MGIERFRFEVMELRKRNDMYLQEKASEMHEGLLTQGEFVDMWNQLNNTHSQLIKRVSIRFMERVLS